MRWVPVSLLALRPVPVEATPWHVTFITPGQGPCCVKASDTRQKGDDFSPLTVFTPRQEFHP